MASDDEATVRQGDGAVMVLTMGTAMHQSMGLNHV
jgi:hypothetical protein